MMTNFRRKILELLQAKPDYSLGLQERLGKDGYWAFLPRIYWALDELEEEGYIASWEEPDKDNERGGRPRRFYRVTGRREPELIQWHRDPAASGWRSRAFLDQYELIAYDDGRWEVRGPPIGHAIAGGTEANGRKAMDRSLKVYGAMLSL